MDQCYLVVLDRMNRVVEFERSRRRAHEDIAEALRDAILDGRIPAGTKLAPERELAERYGVNRTTVREAIKVLEGLRLVSVRQGDGARVQPIVEGSLDLFAPMVFRGGSVDTKALVDLIEVLHPLLYEMARLAVQRCEPDELGEIRRLRGILADDSMSREVRFAASRDVIVHLADLTGNRIWRMMARRTRDLLSSDAMRRARDQLDRDPGDVVPCIDRCLEAMGGGEPESALDALDDYFQHLIDVAQALETDRDCQAS